MYNKLIGSILIIAGASIGAGMLAMPITSAGVGFIGSTILLCTIWFAMCYTSLLMVNIYQHNSPTDGFNTLTTKYTNSFVNKLAGLSLMFLIYGLTAAYISGGGTILKTTIDTLLNTNFNEYIAILIFAILFGGIVIVGTKWVDLISRGLFAIKIILLLLLIVSLIGLVQGINLLQQPLSVGITITAIPAIFTSFGFHGSIPSIVAYLDGDNKLIKKAFIFGSLLPLVIYIIWQILILGSMDQSIFMQLLQENTGLKGLLLSIRTISGNATIETLFSVFAAAALGTSFLGVSIGLFDYYKDVLKNKKNMQNTLAALLTFLPPLLFALFYPQGFIIALGYAAIAGVILALVIPSYLYIKAMHYHQVKIPLYQYAIIIGIFILSITVVYAQIDIVLHS